MSLFVDGINRKLLRWGYTPVHLINGDDERECVFMLASRGEAAYIFCFDYVVSYEVIKEKVDDLKNKLLSSFEGLIGSFRTEIRNYIVSGFYFKATPYLIRLFEKKISISERYGFNIVLWGEKHDAFDPINPTGKVQNSKKAAPCVESSGKDESVDERRGIIKYLTDEQYFKKVSHVTGKVFSGFRGNEKFFLKVYPVGDISANKRRAISNFIEELVPLRFPNTRYSVGVIAEKSYSIAIQDEIIQKEGYSDDLIVGFLNILHSKDTADYFRSKEVENTNLCLGFDDPYFDEIILMAKRLKHHFGKEGESWIDCGLKAIEEIRSDFKRRRRIIHGDIKRVHFISTASGKNYFIDVETVRWGFVEEDIVRIIFFENFKDSVLKKYIHEIDWNIVYIFLIARIQEIANDSENVGVRFWDRFPRKEKVFKKIRSSNE